MLTPPVDLLSQIGFDLATLSTAAHGDPLRLRADKCLPNEKCSFECY